MLSYARSHYCNRLQRLLAIYMSYKWTADSVAKVSDEAMKEVQRMVDKYQHLESYDNMQTSFRVFSQRRQRIHS